MAPWGVTGLLTECPRVPRDEASKHVAPQGSHVVTILSPFNT